MVATMTATYVVSGAGGDIGRAVAERLAERASRAGPLTGWVNNAAVFEDAAVHVPAS
jgi:NAD(P)-dependent dehydrogenase (short-subunit alcohol dehydrogenase family)